MFFFWIEVFSNYSFSNNFDDELVWKLLKSTENWSIPVNATYLMRKCRKIKLQFFFQLDFMKNDFLCQFLNRAHLPLSDRSDIFWSRLQVSDCSPDSL